MAHFDPSARDARELWEGMYSTHGGHVWSGRPNAALVDAVAGLTPGAALDLGCGEGGDVLHLARSGWRVTGVDVSDNAISRAREHAQEAGVGEVTTFQRHDLGRTFPEGTFDLVTASFLHSYAHLDRLEVLRRAAASVAPGGSLVVIGHVGFPEWAHRPDESEFGEVDLPVPDDLRAQLALPEQDWTVRTSALVEREVSDDEGRTGTAVDGVLRLQRR